MTKCLALPTAAVDEIHELLKMGGQVVRPQVLDIQDLASMVPLSRTAYIDVNTTIPLALQDGSIAYPFATLLQAVTLLAGVGGVVLCAPGSYTEPAVTVPAATPLAICGLSPRGQGSAANTTFSNSVSSSSDLAAFNVTFNNGLITSQRIFADNVLVTNLQAAGDTRIQNCTIANATCTAGTFLVFDSTISNNTNLVNVECWSCNWGNVLNCTGNLTARGSTFGNAVIVGGACNLRNCTNSLALTVTGALSTDYSSIAPILASVTAGSVTGLVIAPKVTVSVTVPAVAAGQVGYVDVALAATKLAGLVPAGSLLVANPTADLVAAGAGGGFINVRASAANTARFAFLGPLAGGASNFLLGVL